MATSKTGGAFGFLRKSVGSVTYSTIKDGKGKRVQVVRSKPTEVANPNTVAQIMQRMKVKPASRFYAAYAEVLSNAFEGIQYGDASRREFMKLAMQLDGPFVPKSANRFIPAVYPVSRGSFTGVDLVYDKAKQMSAAFYGKKGFFANFSSYAEGDMDSRTLSYWANEKFGRDVQVTFLVVTQASDGSFVPHYGRLLTADYTATANGGSFLLNLDGFTVFHYGGVLYLYAGTIENDTPAEQGIAAFEAVKAAACIISVKEGETWVRSNADMVINDALQINLYGSEARQTAIESYQDAANVNALNSSWYLNLANGQQFPGQLNLQTVTLEFEQEQEGETVTIQREYVTPVGTQIESDGRARTYVFNNADGNAVFYVNGEFTTVDDLTNAGQKVKWDMYLIQTSLYGARQANWKETYKIQLGL